MLKIASITDMQGVDQVLYNGTKTLKNIINNGAIKKQ